jgi:Protein of unknown function (DUF2924)
MKSVSEEIAELRGMDVPALVGRYEAVFGKPPRVKHRDWLWRRIAWRIQEQRLGGLSTTAQRRLDELIAEIDLGGTVRGRLERAAKPGTPTTGTTLTRMWRGKELLVRVVDGGFEHEGVVYRSLSAAANAITGSHVSGRAFFGLTERKAAK